MHRAGALVAEGVFRTDLKADGVLHALMGRAPRRVDFQHAVGRFLLLPCKRQVVGHPDFGDADGTLHLFNIALDLRGEFAGL